MTEQEFYKLLSLQESGYSIATCVNRYIGNEIVQLDEDLECIYTSNDEDGEDIVNFALSDFIIFKNVTEDFLQ